MTLAAAHATLRALVFAVNSLLQKGVTDYGYGAGFVRLAGAGYGAPALVASYRLGASAGATFGGTIQATRATGSGEFAADLRLRKGAVHLGAGVSARRGSRGAAFDAALQLGADPLSLGASLLYRGPTFAGIDGIGPFALPLPSVSANVTLNRSFGNNAAIALTASHEAYRGATMGQTSYGATGSLAVGRNSELVVQVDTTRAGRLRPASAAYASIVRTLHPGTTLVTSAQSGAGGSSAAGGRARFHLSNRATQS